jgi:hypothetical protein
VTHGTGVVVSAEEVAVSLGLLLGALGAGAVGCAVGFVDGVFFLVFG